MMTGYTSRLWLSILGSAGIHAASLVVLGGFGNFMGNHPAEVSWAEGASTLEISVASVGNSDQPESPREISQVKQPELPKTNASVSSDHVLPVMDERERKPSTKKASSTLSSNEGSPTANSASVSYSPIPPYPESARKAGIEGVVTLRVHIDRDGYVTDVRLVQTSNFTEFDEAAMKTVKSRWRFNPATRLSIPIESDKDIKVRFILK